MIEVKQISSSPILVYRKSVPDEDRLDKFIILSYMGDRVWIRIECLDKVIEAMQQEKTLILANVVEEG